MATLVLAIATLLGVARAEERTTKTLAECIAIALEHHPGLKAAAAAVEAGHARTWEATAKYLPDVNGLYSANWRHASPAARTGTNIDTRARTFNFYNTGVSFSQVLFDFGQTLNTIRAAQDAEQSLRADAITERETVVFNVKLAYFDGLTARRLLGVALETLRQTRKHLDEAHERFAVGLAPKFDVTQAQVLLATAEFNEVVARNAVSLASETLRTALGLTAPLTFDLVDSFEFHEAAVNEADTLSRAFDARPELQSLRARELGLTEQLAALKTEFLPNIAAVANYNESGSTYPLKPNWNLGANVTLSIFNGGLTTAQIGEATANLSQLRFNEEALRQQIALEVRSAVLNLQQAAESIRVAEKGLQAARENLNLAEGRYSTGVGNIIELTDAQALLTAAQATQVESVYGYKKALAALEKATATAFTPD